MPWLARPHTLAEDEVWVAEVLLPGSDVIVAIDPLNEDNVLAVMALTPGWIEQLYVATAQQRRGLGSRLLRHAQSTTVASLHLWTFQRNLAARAFYERHGFAEMRRTTGENEEREPDVLYEWNPGRRGVLLADNDHVSG
ncbi:GNAT family N-acetyltransferase [Microbacterium hominis]|uniref:GNAT family N-acetyltransferase n=1 Tax=Microbacterium hominis TaxID=162426 RepID=A0A7D4PVE2_9MICO|nr:GNAT family N-acetyltransferase [Microbacterium hominis]QKJ19734.1 GNAT family N-acetyltransferase [Microbacterium hominis]